jgi:hypothetical protein
MAPKSKLDMQDCFILGFRVCLFAQFLIVAFIESSTLIERRLSSISLSTPFAFSLYVIWQVFAIKFCNLHRVIWNSKLQQPPF